MKSMVVGGLGQDGSFLIDRLVGDQEVICVHRREIVVEKHGVRYHRLENKENEIRSLIETEKPDVIFNFAGVSNVFDPWKNVDETISLNATLPACIISEILKSTPQTKFVQASSSLVFGFSSESCNEETRREPITPYGIAKNTTDSLIAEARKIYNLNACSAVLFNHESERRGDNFFTKKVINAAIDFSRGLRHEPLILGNLDSSRDMGYAWEYVQALHEISSLDVLEDFVIGTGSLTSMRDFVKEAFGYFGLNYEEHVIENSLTNRIEVPWPVKADSRKLYKKIGWIAQKLTTHTLVDRVVKWRDTNARTI